MSEQIAALKDRVNQLHRQVNGLRAQLGYEDSQHSSAAQQQPPHGAIDPSLQLGLLQSQSASRPKTQANAGTGPIVPVSPNTSRPKSQCQKQTFRGPTSNQFNFSVAKSSLRTMGITSYSDSLEDANEGPGDTTRDPSPVGEPQAYQVQSDLHPGSDPIWNVSHDEAIRLCRVWEDEIGLMYPVLNINKVIVFAHKLYGSMETARRSGQGLPSTNGIDDEDTNLLKLILASAMMVECAGWNELGSRIFEHTRPAIDNLLGDIGIKGIQLLTMAVRKLSTRFCPLFLSLTRYRPCMSFIETTKEDLGA